MTRVQVSNISLIILLLLECVNECMSFVKLFFHKSLSCPCMFLHGYLQVMHVLTYVWMAMHVLTCVCMAMHVHACVHVAISTPFMYLHGYLCIACM
jgi:hypothetical protein